MQDKFIYFEVFNMLKYFLLFSMMLVAIPAQAQMSSLSEAKYITVLNVISNHKMKDEDLEKDLVKLRESERFKSELKIMLGKLDNSRPNEANNRKIMRILEKAGKEIYNELK